MQEFAPTKSRLSGDCPSDEELAAYIDGALGKEEADRIAGHLVSCVRCFEIYSETVQFQLEPEPVAQGEVVPFPANRERRRSIVRYGLPIAAMLLVGIGGAVYFQLLAPPPDLAHVTPGLPSLPNGAQPMWLGPTTRGEGNDEELKLDESSFRMGVQLVNLRAALKAGKKREAEDVVARIIGLLKPQPISGDLANDYTALTKALESGKPLGVQDGLHRPLLRGAAQRKHAADTLAAFVEANRLGEVYRKDFEPGAPFDFGQWIEAGYLAAQSRDPSFFQWDVSRAFLRRLLWRDKLHDLLRIDDPKLDPDTRKNLDRIAEIISKGDLQPADYTDLTTQITEILGKYYPDH